MVTITGLDFADDTALVRDEIAQAQQLLSREEVSTAKIGLHTNAKKAECMSFKPIKCC